MTSMSWDAALAPSDSDAGGPRRRGPLWFTTALAGIGAAAWLLWGQLASGALLPLETVRFSGDMTHVSESELRRAVAPHVGGSWLAADVTPMRRAVEALPWVRAVAIRRVWPDALRITITEHEPQARWRDDGLISRRGEVFRPATRPKDLPALAGPEGTNEQILSTYRTLSSRLADVSLQLVGLRRDDRRSWRGELGSGTALVVGRSNPVDRVARLVAAWPKLDRRAEAAKRVDLRYPNGFAIRWRPDGADDTQRAGGADK